MSTDGQALLQAILEDPADDTLRLVYADYLEERGDPRAELIRVQCHRAARGCEFCRGFSQEPCPGMICESLRRYEQDLLATMLDVSTPTQRIQERASVAWAKPALGRYVHVIDQTWRRGFIAEVQCQFDHFLVVAPALLALHPLEQVWLTRVSGATGGIMSLMVFPSEKPRHAHDHGNHRFWRVRLGWNAGVYYSTESHWPSHTDMAQWLPIVLRQVVEVGAVRSTVDRDLVIHGNPEAPRPHSLMDARGNRL